jgi:anti-anti-sigma factor
VRIKVTKQGNTAVLRLNGRFNHEAVTDFRQALQPSLYDDTVRVIEIDLAAAEYVDSVWLGVVIQGYGQAKAQGKTLVLAGATGPVLDALRISYIHKLLEVR